MYSSDLKRMEVVAYERTVMEIKFQPGNGTMYEIVIAARHNGEFAVAWIGGNRRGHGCASFHPDELLHWVYAKEKLGMSGPDLAAVMLALREALHFKVTMEPGYGRDARFHEDSE